MVAREMSPNLNRKLLSATFTPMGKTLKAYSIPKTKVPCSERISPALSWHDLNFPSPGHKETFTIGCANAPKVNNINTKKESNNNRKFALQATRVEAAASTTPNSTNAKPKVIGNPSS